MCGNPDDASDVLQDTLIAMAGAIERFRGDSALSTWIYTIARRACLRHRRRSRIAPGGTTSIDRLDARQRASLASANPGPEESAARHERAAALDRALRALPPPQREVLLLRDVEGLAGEDVARVLGIGVRAMKSRLHRARKALHAALAPPTAPTAATTSRPGAPCRDVLDVFSRHLEGELAPTACASMEAHLRGCPRCRGACASLREALALCRRTPSPAVPAAVERRVRRAVQRFLDESRSGSRRGRPVRARGTPSGRTAG
jgi:RNA polymerase sigma-70 factor (ECF subfamily)